MTTSSGAVLSEARQSTALQPSSRRVTTRLGQKEHVHPAEPGSMIAVQIKKEV